MALEIISYSGTGLYVAVAVLLGAAGHYLLLRIRQRAHLVPGRLAQDRLAEVATRLRDYAGHHNQQLPASLREVAEEESSGVMYRPVSFLTLDPRLVLLHDRRATQKLLEFPRLRDGRGLVFCSGRLHVVSEEVFEKLIEADDRLRLKLGLAPAVEDTDG